MMIAFSMDSLWVQFNATSPVPQSPQATTISLMTRALGSRAAAVDLTRSLESLSADRVVVLVSTDQNWEATLLHYLVRYVTWPRQLQLVQCAGPATSAVAPADSTVILANSERASVPGEVRQISPHVALVEVAPRAESVACL